MKMMKKIKLHNCNDYALVDDDDFEYLQWFKWTKTTSNGRCQNYARVHLGGKEMKMHREIWDMPLPKQEEIDHINHNGLDNRKCNLIICTSQQNTFNQRPQLGKKYSKFKGVTYNKQIKRWQSQIRHNGVHYYLGTFKKEILAALAYNKAAREKFGEFAYLNPITP